MQLLLVLINSGQFGTVDTNTVECVAAHAATVWSYGGGTTARSMGALRHINHYTHAHSAYACVDNKGFITTLL